MTELAVGELARRSGVRVSAIHFYERKGLIASVRTSGNQRRYERDTLRRVAIIRMAQQVGIPLAEVVHLFAALPEAAKTTRRDWQKISKRWADDLDRRIALLRDLRANLGDCIGCGCLSLSRCNLLNPDDQLATKGPGPHRLRAARTRI